jgi:PAS domain S-box-containing protein
LVARPLAYRGRAATVLAVRDVSERRRAQAALRESEARLRAVVESLPFDLWACDWEGRHVLQNPASRRHWGDRVGMRPDEIGIAPEVVAEWLAHNRCVLAGEIVRAETSHRVGGELRHAEKVLAPIEIEGRILGYVGINIDVTARERAEAALREGEERLRLAVEATGLGIWDADPRIGACRWSAECRAILGLSREAAAGLDAFASLIHPKDRAWVLELYRRACEPAGSGRYEAEFRILRGPDRAERWVQATGRVHFDAAGRPTRAVGTLADVTERRRAHEELRESEGRYRALVETSPDAVYAHREGIIILANARAVELLGAKSPEELIGRSIFELVDPSSLPLVRARTAALAEPGAQIALAELTYRRLDGTPFPVEAAAAAVLVQGRLVVQVVFRDLTARKAAEAELRHAHERLARHMDNTPLAVVELACRPGDDVAWRVKAWSGQAEAMFGWAAAEATGRTLQELALVYEADRDKAVLLRRDLLGQRPRTAARLRCRTRTGEVRHCHIHASVVPGDAGRPEAALLLVEDITDQVTAQESVQRLAQHDELTGLPNRHLFQDRLGQALARAGREGELVGAMLLDLDHFKEVNDTLGHSAGDARLGEVAARLCGPAPGTATPGPGSAATSSPWCRWACASRAAPR